MMNPAAMMKVAGLFKKFQADHPKVVSYVQHFVSTGIPEGSVIEITITKPGAQPVTTNFRVLQDDVEMVETLKNMQK